MALLNGTFSTHFCFCPGEFSDNFPSEFLLAGSSERQGFLSNTRKASQDQKQTILCALQAAISDKNEIFNKNVNVGDMLQ